MQKLTEVVKLSLMKVTAGWKHNAAITAGGELLTWGWGGSAGTQVSMLQGLFKAFRVLVDMKADDDCTVRW